MSRGVYIGLDLPEDHHITLVHFGKVGVNKRLKPIEHFWDIAAQVAEEFAPMPITRTSFDEFGWSEKVLAMRVASEPIVPVRNRVLELAGRKQNTVFEPHITLRGVILPEFTHSYGLIFQYGDHIEKFPFQEGGKQWITSAITSLTTSPCAPQVTDWLHYNWRLSTPRTRP